MTDNQKNSLTSSYYDSDPTTKPAKLISRRQILTTGAATAVSLLVLPKGAQAENRQQMASCDFAPLANCTAPPTDCSSPSLTLPSDGNFTFPELLTSQHIGGSGDTFRTLSKNLDLVQVDDTPSAGVYVRRLKIRNQGQPLLPGPTLCVYPGDQIALNVKNDLPANGPDTTYCPVPLTDNLKNRPHCFNTTNLHFHGLHVSPLTYTPDGPVTGDDEKAKEAGAKSSDDVLFDLQPGENHNWCVQLPDFHAPGTHWYHAHVHGTTALDLSNGIVGALIVQEPPGQEILAGAPDVVMVIQEILPAIPCSSILSDDQCNTTPPPISPQQSQDRGVYEQAGNKQSGTFLVNGREKPTLTIKKGEVQRWRLINGTGTPRGFMVIEVVQTATYNANTGDYEPVVVVQQPLYRVAIDGITLYGKSMTSPEVQVTSHELSPGNRVDFLVSLPSGKYQLQKQSFPGVRASRPAVLADITVTNEEYSDSSLKQKFDDLVDNAKNIPGTPPCYLADFTEDATLNPKRLVFQASGGTPPNRITTPGRGNFKISNTQYGDPGALMTVPLGDTQDWILANVSNATHPFHIHVNPFQIVQIGKLEQFPGEILDNNTFNPTITWEEKINDGIWWDTIAVKPKQALRIRHRFWDYWGSFVLHCHVLIHEDQGMMWRVDITNTENKGVNPCQTLPNCITDYGKSSAQNKKTTKKKNRGKMRGKNKKS
ncbi:MAG: multicopper oxidase domain-containing protein [Symploca sp. SIO3E6]|nr:multicopper oxidase domain-containing protein [Caldora sp. SIO3E6]